jgi:hypothetical protein
MWARVIEFMLGCWFAISPFAFGHDDAEMAFWLTDLTAACLIMILSLASFWPPLRHAHLALVLVASWLILFGRFAISPPLPPAAQNYILVGLLLLMFALIPNNASDRPRHWLPAVSSIR